MKKPQPPKEPVAPVMPTRTYQRKTHYRIDLYEVTSLASLVNRVPDGILHDKVTLEEEGEYDDHCYYFQYVVETPYTMTEAEWLEALRRYDKAVTKYQECLVAYGAKLALYRESLKMQEEQEKSLLASLKAKYPEASQS